MSYATEVVKDSVKSHVMIRIQPRILVSGFAVHSGNVYVASLKVDYVFSVGAATVAKSSAAACTANTDFYYDAGAELLYMYSSTAVVSGDEFVTTFEMYFATLSCLWYRIPTDSTTDTVEWTANISSPPDISSSLGDQAFGVNVIDASGFSVFFDPEKHQHLISEASFKNVQVWVYHLAGRLEVANIDSLFYGLLDDKVTFDFTNIQFGLTQKSFAIDGALSRTAIRSAAANGVDPSYYDQPARAIKGSVGEVGAVSSGSPATSFTYIYGMAPVNVSFVDSSPTTSNNRSWALFLDGYYAGGGINTGSESSGTMSPIPSFLGGVHVGDHSGGANAGGVHTGDYTWKYVSHVGGIYPAQFAPFRVGQRVRVRNLTSVTNYYPLVTDRTVTAPGNVEELQFDTNVGTGDVLVSRFVTSRVFLVQNNSYFELMPVRDYYVRGRTGEENNQRIVLTTSAESSVGAATIDPSNGDYLVATIDVAGVMEAYKITVDAVDYYLDGIAGRILTYLAEDMFLAYETVGGVTSRLDLDDVFDLQSFLDYAQNADTYHEGTTRVWDDSWCPVGLLPESQGDAQPNHTEVLAKLLEAGRAVLFYSPDELIKIKSLDVGTSVGTIELEDVVAKSMRFDVDFRDVDNVSYEDFVSEVGLVGAATAVVQFRPNVVSNANDPDDGGSNTTLHGTTNARKVSSKPLTLRPNRKGTVTLKTTLQLVASDVGSTVTLKSKYLPGFQYDGETIHEADYVITEIKKGVDGVEITLDI
jgi:hypothetical protein